jgi:NAD(P)-dependent dehydrogenase (short-subunit alcohol dehydrogenase family)
MLRGRVSVVTGASRDTGRGIALAPGEAGAVVYVTGRSETGTTTEGLPGTVQEAAEDACYSIHCSRPGCSYHKCSRHKS